MGDNLDSKNSEEKSPDNRDAISSSSDVVASTAVSTNVEGSSHSISYSNEVSSSEAGCAMTATKLEVDTCNLDASIISSSSDLLPKEGSNEEPDSTDSVLEINRRESVDDDLFDFAVSDMVTSCEDVTADGPDSSDCAGEATNRDVDDAPDLMDSVVEACCKESVGDDTLPYDSIMDVCSTAAQQIKKTINEALKSRESVSVKLLEPDDFCSSLEANLKKKIADFEKTVEKTNSPTKELSDSSLSENCISSEQSGNSSSSEISQTDCDKKATATSVLSSSEPLRDTSDICTNSNSTSSVPVQKCSSEVIESTPSPNSEVLVVHEISSDNDKSKKNQKSSAVKKKGEKSVDQILKSLGSCSSTEEKLLTLCRKHIEVLEDSRSNEIRLKQCERQAVVTLREKEQLQADHNRTILAKSRLESLCRELQRQNKAVKEESLLRIREEEEKRKDVASKFQVTLNDISNLMQDNSKKNLQLREENAELAKKLKSLVEHYEMWEKHMGKVLQQKDLEVQLAKAKLAKTNLQLKQETEKFLREKKDLLENMSELQKKCTELASNEVQLRTELSVYTAKYEEFQTVLNKSNQVFASFKTDMDTTSKKIKKLEKETNLWKTKWENSNGALLEMIADKQKRDKELLNAQQRVLMLEKLCRALQAERNDLQSQVKELCTTDNAVSSSEEVASTQ